MSTGEKKGTSQDMLYSIFIIREDVEWFYGAACQEIEEI